MKTGITDGDCVALGRVEDIRAAGVDAVLSTC
jgi:hypothetical protein